MSRNTERNGKGEHRTKVRNFDRRVRDKERSSERSDHKKKLRNFIEGNHSHLREDDLDEFER